MKKKGCRIIAFLCILSLVFLKVNSILSFKYTDGVLQMERFYELEEGTVDVLVLGSSHAFVNVNPAVLYEEYGIAAYNLCASMQPTWNTYYYLKEALEYQTPELIVMDVYRLVEEFDYSKNSKIVKNTYGMRFGKNKYEAVKANVREGETGLVWMHMLEFPVFHSRYAELTKEDFRPEIIASENYKGFHPLFETNKMTKPDIRFIEEKTEIAPKTLEYFEKILELAEEKDIPLLLINAPYIMSADDKKIFNSLEEYLSRQTINDDVRYLDLNVRYNKVGIKFKTDFADENHLNVKGVQKFNLYLGKYIKKHYEISDRRGDAAFVSYEENVKEWKALLESKEE